MMTTMMGMRISETRSAKGFSHFHIDAESFLHFHEAVIGRHKIYHQDFNYNVRYKNVSVLMRSST